MLRTEPQALVQRLDPTYTRALEAAVTGLLATLDSAA